MTYDPSIRVLTVLEILQTREEVTGAELARTLEVSPRTVQRYVMRLQDLGIPVQGRRGVGVAYRLKPGFRLPPLMFTPDEALSLTLGLRALQQLGLSDLMPAAQGAGRKLARTLPETLRAEVQAIENSIQLDPSPWVVTTGAALLTALLRAVRECRSVAFAYRSGQGVGTRRTVQVYRVLHLDGRWYAVGHCLKRGALRSFRLDRIGELEVQEDRFEPPPDFDALAFLRSTLPPAPRSFEVDVWLDAPPEELQGSVSMWFTDVCAEQGGTRLRARRERLNHFAAFLLGLGVPFRVTSPPELLDELRAIGERCRELAGAVPAHM